MTVKCPKCQYVWESRKPEPKSCPRCKVRLDTPYKIKGDETSGSMEGPNNG